MAVNQKMRFAPGREITLERVPEGQNLLDMARLRKLDARARLDRVVEMHLDAVMRVVGPEGLGLGPIRIENREHMRDGARRVIAEFVKTTDSEVGEKLCRHGSAHIIVVRQRETKVSKGVSANDAHFTGSLWPRRASRDRLLPLGGAQRPRPLLARSHRLRGLHR